MPKATQEAAMTDSGAERAARRIGEAYIGAMLTQGDLNIMSAIIREETGTQWISPYDFPEEDGEYLLVFDDGKYSVGNFYRQDETTGHWFPSWGLKGWQPLPAAPDEGGKR